MTNNPVRMLALLRGINVGGRNKLAMKDLREWFISAGHNNVATYIQSGNIVFDPPAAADSSLAPDLDLHLTDLISEGIANAFGLEVSVVLRTGGELAQVVSNNPLFGEQIEPKNLHVLFLADKPDPEAAARLDPDRSPGDVFAVIDHEVYIRYAKGAGQTKLTLDWFERGLSTTATARNWNTTTKLLAMI